MATRSATKPGASPGARRPSSRASSALAKATSTNSTMRSTRCCRAGSGSWPSRAARATQTDRKLAALSDSRTRRRKLGSNEACSRNRAQKLRGASTVCSARGATKASTSARTLGSGPRPASSANRRRLIGSMRASTTARTSPSREPK
jgi:hypothetical protein